jgi:hypothetical protein
MNGRFFSLLAVGLTEAAMAFAQGSAAAPHTSGKSSQALWTGKSGGFEVIWTKSDLAAKSTSTNEIVFSFSSLAKQGFLTYENQVKTAQLGKCTYTREARPVSLVGSQLTFSDVYDSSCDSEAHPSSDYRITTVDLRRTSASKYTPSVDDPASLDMASLGPVVALTSLFGREEILTKIAADPLLKRYLSAAPKTLDDIRNALGDEGVKPTKSPCSFTLAPDYPTRFSFHHLIGNQLAVRLELSPIGGACRGAKADLGILLAMPPDLRPALDAAAAGRSGFLAKNQPTLPSINKTIVEFTTFTGKPIQ